MYRQVGKWQKGFSTHCSLCRFSLDAISHGRVFLALVGQQEDRGTVVAQGGGKVEHPNKYSWCNLKKLK